MTTIIYRDSGNRRPSFFTTTGALSQVAIYSGLLAERWSKWQAAREIEAMPLDIRKDLGWPAADIAEDAK
ncbi:MAG: hypothetical protein ABWY49_13425 [Rhizobium sp.]